MIGRVLVVLAVTVTWAGATLAQHGVAIDRGSAGWAVRVLGAVIVGVVAIYTVKFLVRPGEQGREHIKRRILDDDWPGGDDER